MVGLALTGICPGQQSQEGKRFQEDYARSAQQAAVEFPDVGNAATPLAQKVAEMDKALAAEEDPLYNSADKPLILARKAAKQLGVKPAEARPIPTKAPQAPVELDGKVIPEMNGYKSVTIRGVEPDGIRVIHESGTSKIPIEKLTEEQRAKYGLTVEGAAQFRSRVAQSEATTYAQEKQAEKEKAADQQAAKEKAADQQASTPASAVKFITADQVKSYWVKKLPQPRSLDPNYSRIMKAYSEFVGEIRDGKRDLDAHETAAIYNKARAFEIGNAELARTYEAELGRISQAKSAAKALAAQQEQARQNHADLRALSFQLSSIDSNLRSLRTAINSW